MPMQTPGQSVLFFCSDTSTDSIPQSHKSLMCLISLALHCKVSIPLLFWWYYKAIAQGKGKNSQPRKGPRSSPNPAVSWGRMGSFILCSLEFEQGSQQQQATARSLHYLCHLCSCLDSMCHCLDGIGQHQKCQVWFLLFNRITFLY